jgi:hypothetical protein
VAETRVARLGAGPESRSQVQGAPRRRGTLRFVASAWATRKALPRSRKERRDDAIEDNDTALAFRAARVALVYVGSTLVALAGSVYALAGHSPGQVPSYTGCLKNGKIDRLMPGDAPASPCAVGETEAHLSGGDITRINAGAGLSGGSEQGEAALHVDPGQVQSRVTGVCSDVRANDASIRAIHEDGSVTCNPDDVGSGDITGVDAGFGIAQMEWRRLTIAAVQLDDILESGLN